MQGYKFNNETQAIKARKDAADYMGLPVPNGETLYWVNYNYSDVDGFWYIIYVEGLEAVLGQPTEITITIHDEIN